MYSIQHRDLGTPPSQGKKLVTVHIDGQPVEVPEGTTVMRAAALAGVSVPKLCASDNLKAFGSCRVCLVEIEGRRGYPASCTTEVVEGMKIRTESEKLTQLRKGVVELYVSEHPLDCDTCPADQHCELQDVAERLNVKQSPYLPSDLRPITVEAEHRDFTQDGSNPYFNFNPDLCIVCSRCVRACDEIQGTLALTVSGRGLGSQISASQNESFLSSECVSCGACVEACPTAALSEKPLADSPIVAFKPYPVGEWQTRAQVSTLFVPNAARTIF